MTARWETEFWNLLSPDTARRLKIELGIGSDTTDANSAPPVGVPDTAGGALLIPGEGDRVQMHSHNNTRVWHGTVMRFLPSTPAGHCRVLWDTPLGDHISVEDMDHLEVTS